MARPDHIYLTAAGDFSIASNYPLKKANWVLLTEAFEKALLKFNPSALPSIDVSASKFKKAILVAGRCFISAQHVRDCNLSLPSNIRVFLQERKALKSPPLLRSEASPKPSPLKYRIMQNANTGRSRNLPPTGYHFPKSGGLSSNSTPTQPKNPV